MTNDNYDFDVVIWDTVGGAYDVNSMRKASGGSEKEVVQLAEGLGKAGFKVCCFNQTRDPFGDGGAGWSEWKSLQHAKGIRCKTLIIQRYSTIPDSTQILPDRMVVRATDVYGKYYDHLSALNYLCVSEWQAKMYRDAGFSILAVVPAMLDDDYYELATTPKVRGRFIYASAAMKGLKETCEKWIDLKKRFPVEMKECALQVTSPGYGRVRAVVKFEDTRDYSIYMMDDLPPRELAKYMATCEGLFYVNVWPETFGAVLAIAEAVGCRVHVLAKDVAGLKEAARGGTFEWRETWTEDFDRYFIESLRLRWDPIKPFDFRVSTVLPKWLAALRLESAPGSGVSEAQVQAGLQVIRDTDVLRHTAHEGLEKAIEHVHTIAERMRAGLTDKERAILDKRYTLTNKIVGYGFEDGTVSMIPQGLKIDEKKEQKMEPKTPTVCLVMLAKNAESTMRRALESVKGFVDKVVIGFDDVASSGDMKAIVDDMFGDRPTIAYRKWINFSHNRNELLRTAREFSPTDYALVLDADDEFVGLSTFDKTQLTLDCYEVEIHDFGGSTRYPRRMLWRNDGRFHYEGPAHEFIVEKGNVTTGRLQGVHYVRHGGVALTPEQTREKYLRDVRLFVAELKAHPEDTRSVYYLAQSLEDASCGTDEVLLRQALKVYQKRALMAGFVEEKFISHMKVGRLRARFKEAASAVVHAFEFAAMAIPARSAEAVYEILLYHNQPGNLGASYARGLEAVRKFPESFSDTPPDGFIVDVEVYRWKFKLQFALALYYTGDKKAARDVFEDLLGKVPAEQREVIRANLQFCLPPVQIEGELLDELETSYGTPPKREEGFDFRVGQGTPELGASIFEGTPRAPAVPWFTPKG